MSELPPGIGVGNGLDVDPIFLDTDPVVNEPPPPTSNTNGETGVPPTSISNGDVEQPLAVEPEWFQETCGEAVGHITNSRPTRLEMDQQLTFTVAAVVARSDFLWENNMVRVLQFQKSLKISRLYRKLHTASLPHSHTRTKKRGDKTKFASQLVNGRNMQTYISDISTIQN
jgi:hypothetical protein